MLSNYILNKLFKNSCDFNKHVPLKKEYVNENDTDEIEMRSRERTDKAFYSTENRDIKEMLDQKILRKRKLDLGLRIGIIILESILAMMFIIV